MLHRSFMLCLKNNWFKFKVATKSLFYNDHLSSSYVGDILMEPMFWFVDNFTKCLGPFFVVAVIGLTTSVIFLCFYIGLPYWWKRDVNSTVLLLIVGHWLLANVIFHYCMGCTVSPGHPPEGTLIPEAASMCKKCIAPKPPRTHHCSICNKCILKMDHHCPWLNNCVGLRNHHHFFLYMVYTALGVLFIIIFGLELFLEEVWWKEEELVGYPVRNDSSAIVVDESLENGDQKWNRNALIYMAFVCCGVFIALTLLSLWHARLITRGETSIEANINKTETVRYAAEGETYVNPFNLGRRKNWAVFLGIQDKPPLQGALRVLFPSFHQSRGNGLTWVTNYDILESQYQKVKKI